MSTTAYAITYAPSTKGSTMPIKGGKVTNIKQMRRDLKKRSGNFLHRVPTDEPQTFRFLTEPEEWFGYTEHFDEVNKFFPCSGTPDCEGCQNQNFGSQRYLTNAVLVDDDKVVPLVLPKSAASSLLRNFDRHTTVMDRDYTITRTGSGKNDTEYAVDAEAPSSVRMAKYIKQMVDLEAILEQQLPKDAEDDGEVDDTPRGRGSAGVAKKAASRRRTPEPVEDVEDEEEAEVDEDSDDADDDSEEALRETLNAHKLPRLKSIARNEYEITDNQMKGLDKNDLIDLILEVATDEDEGDEDADDEDLDEDEADADDEGGDEDEDEDGEDYPQYTSAQLRKMSIAELKEIADDYEITYRSNTKPPKLITDIVAAQNEYFGTDDPDF